MASAYTLAIYGVTGRLVQRYTGFAKPGIVSIIWDGTDKSGRNVATGVYFYTAQAGDFTETKKMTLLK